MKSLAHLVAGVACLAPVLAQSSDPDGNTGVTATTLSLPTAGQTSVPVPTQTRCPTITATRELCTTCLIPACLALSTITQSCGCPTPIPTVFLDFPCGSGCSGAWCSTSYATVTATGCPGDGDGDGDSEGTASVTSEPSIPTFAPNTTMSRTLTSASSSIATNAAGRMRVPFWF